MVMWAFWWRYLSSTEDFLWQKRQSAYCLAILPDPGTVKAIVQHLKGNPCVAGVHDLMVHDYGPGRVLASVHAEVPDDSDIVQVHEMIDAMEQEIEQDLGIHIVIHMDPIAVHSPVVKRMRELVGGIVSSLCPGCSIHDFA